MLRRQLSQIIIFFFSVFVDIISVQGYGWTTIDWQWPSFNITSPFEQSDETITLPQSKYIVTFVNGIYHNEGDWLRVTEQLDAVFGQEVRAFYNPSTGSFLADLAGAFYDLLCRSNSHNVARALSAHLRQALTDSGPKGRVLHLAHSGGALVTYLAGKYHLKSSERARIDVATFGGAHSITRKFFPGHTVNYYARNDPLVQVDRRAAFLMKEASNGTYHEVVYAKYETPFVFMEGQARSSMFDHSLEGPTYKVALDLEADSLRRRARKSLGTKTKNETIASSSGLHFMRKRSAEITGLHNFFTDTEIIRSSRKTFANLTGLHGYFSGKKKDENTDNEEDNSWKLMLPSLDTLRAHRREEFLRQEKLRTELAENLVELGMEILNNSRKIVDFKEIGRKNGTESDVERGAMLIIDFGKFMREKAAWVNFPGIFGFSRAANNTEIDSTVFDEKKEQAIIQKEIESLKIQLDNEEPRWWERRLEKVANWWRKTPSENRNPS